MRIRFFTGLIIGIFLFLLLSWYFQNIFVYILISFVLATILRTPTNYLNQLHLGRFRLPRFLAVLISFAAFGGVGVFFFVLFIPLFSEQIQILGEINYDRVFDQLGTPISSFENFLIENNLTAIEPGFIIESIRSSIFDFITNVKVGEIVNSVISYTGSMLAAVMAITFISFFLLFEKGMVRGKVISLIPNGYFEMVITALNKIESLLSNYLVGLFIQMLSIFSIVSFGLSLVGVKYALTIGLFAAFANLIPYAGPLLGASFGIIVGLSTSTAGFSVFDEAGVMVLKILIVFGIVQLIDNILLQPLIFSKSVKAHPLEIFVVIFAGATLAGVVGMILAIPTYTILRVSFVEIYFGYKEYQVFDH